MFLRRVIPLLLLVAFSSSPAYAAWVQTSGPRGGMIRSLAALPDGQLFAGQIHVWRSGDNGSNWQLFDDGLTDPNAFTLVTVGSDLYVGTNGGVFRSSDAGVHWTPLNTGLTNLSIYALASGGGNLYAGAWLGNMYRSSDGGANWTKIENGFPVGYNVNAVTTTPAGTVLAGTMNGIYRSTNAGGSWTRVFTLYGFAFARSGSTLIAGTSNGVYRSIDDGATWTPINAGLTFSWIRSVATIGSTLFAGAGGVLRSTDNGATWVPATTGMGNLPVNALIAIGTELYAGTSEGIFRSTDQGAHWTNVSFVSSGVRALLVTPTGNVLAATENDIFRSGDLGGSWVDMQSNTTALDFAVNPTTGSVFAGGSPAGVYKSLDDGVTWTDTNTNINDLDVNSVAAVPNGSGGTNMLAGTYSELFLSPDDGASWLSVGLRTLTLDYVVAGDDVWTGGFGGVWRSTTFGTSWTPANAGLEDKIVQAVAAVGSTLYAAGDPFGVYRSTDEGASWSPANTGLTDLRVSSLLVVGGSNLFAGGAGGVHLSIDGGDHWTPVGDGLTTGVNRLALSADGTTLIAGTGRFGVWTRPLSEMLPLVGVTPPPPALSLRAGVPNPFFATTTLSYTLPRSGSVRLAIHDVNGRLVRVLVDGMQPAGDRSATWDGRDARGTIVPSGIYVSRLEALGEVRTGKLSRFR